VQKSSREGRSVGLLSLLQLDQLIQAALTPEKLHLEEATTANLMTLLQRLEASANVVREVLARGTEL